MLHRARKVIGDARGISQNVIHKIRKHDIHFCNTHRLCVAIRECTMEIYGNHTGF